MPAPASPQDGAPGEPVARLRQAMAAGTLTSAALTAQCLDRIAQLNPRLRAVITVSPQAAAEAARRDQERTTQSGPLHGIPVLVKDNIAVAGLPATAGSPALLGAETGDSFLAGRLRAAGAVILGKANLSEWANFRSTQSSSGWSTLGGQAANPHALDRNPSGSSSGSGVAVAAGLAPLAVGTETDGSIVCPARARAPWPSSSTTTSTTLARCWCTSARNCSSRPRRPARTRPTRPHGRPGPRRGPAPGRRWTARWPPTGSTRSSRSPPTRPA